MNDIEQKSGALPNGLDPRALDKQTAISVLVANQFEMGFDPRDPPQVVKDLIDAGETLDLSPLHTKKEI